MATCGVGLIRRLLAPSVSVACAIGGALVGAAAGAWINPAVATLLAAGGAGLGASVGLVVAALTPPHDALAPVMVQLRSGKLPEGEGDDIAFLRALTTKAIGAVEQAEVTKVAERRAAKAEAKLITARAAAKDAEEVRQAFLTRMSHELRTPLNAVLGYSEMVAEEIDRDDLKADLERVRRAALHLQGLVTSVLDLAQLQSGRHAVSPEIIALDELVHHIVDGARNEADTNHNTLRVEVEAGIEATLDRRMVSSILFNLIHNAVKYTARGTVTVSVRVTDRVRLLVSDTGIGMTPQQVAAATVPFSQADDSTTRRYDGAGLGLAICHGFAEAMGGSLQIESAPGQGARVTVDLPRVAARVEPPDEDPDEPTMLLR